MRTVGRRVPARPDQDVRPLGQPAVRPRHALVAPRAPRRPAAVGAVGLPRLARPADVGDGRPRHGHGHDLDGGPGAGAVGHRPRGRRRHRRGQHPRPGDVVPGPAGPVRRHGAVDAGAALARGVELVPRRAGVVPGGRAPRVPHRRRAPPHPAHRRGRLDGRVRRDPARRRLRGDRPVRRQHGRLRRRRGPALAVVGDARGGRRRGRAGAHRGPRPGDPPSAGGAVGAPRGVREAHHARVRHRRRAAGAPRPRRGEGLPRPVRGAVGAGPRGRRAGRVGPGRPRLRPGAAAGRVRRPGHLARRPVRRRRRHHPRRAGRLLRLRGVPGRAAAHGHRDAAEAEPRPRRRAQDPRRPRGGHLGARAGRAASPGRARCPTSSTPSAACTWHRERSPPSSAPRRPRRRASPSGWPG